MDTTVWFVIVLVVVLALVLAGFLAGRRRRRQRLQERFGPEYDRAVAEAGSRRQAEGQLQEVQRRREALDIRPLDPASADRFRQRWEAVQARFVDEPSQAVAEADDLIGSVMRERGYPVDDPEDSAALVSADHPDVVQKYRKARSLRFREGSGDGSDGTESLRLALVHYRALFTALVDDRPARRGQEAGGRRDTVADHDRPGHPTHRERPGDAAALHGDPPSSDGVGESGREPRHRQGAAPAGSAPAEEPAPAPADEPAPADPTAGDATPGDAGGPPRRG